MSKETRPNQRTIRSESDEPSQIQPGYFLSLRVRNIRCFGNEEETLVLSDDDGRPYRWTILLGDNGTGKTTLLQSLAALEYIVGGPARAEKATRRDSRNDLYPRGIHYCFLSPKWNVARYNTDAPAHLIAELGFGNSLDSKSGSFQKGVVSLQLSAFKAKFDTPVPCQPRCYGYGASRRLSSVSLAKNDTDDSTLSLFSDEAHLRGAEEWLLKLDYSAGKASSIQNEQRSRFEKIRNLLIDILPDVDDIRLTAPESLRPDPSVQFKTPYGWVSLRELGHGYRTLIAWMVDLASRLVEDYPESNSPLSEPAVVLIDEIDLHLHPTWQRSLIQYLTDCFPNTQFIATAHSPLIVQAASGANLVLLKKVEDHVTVNCDFKAVRGWRIDQVLTSDLFGIESARPPQYDDLLKERRRLLTKSTLTRQEKARLKKLESQIGDLPAGESEIMLKIQQLLDKTTKSSQ